MRVRDTGLLLGIAFPLVVAACGDGDETSPGDGDAGSAGSSGNGGSTGKGGAAGKGGSVGRGGSSDAGTGGDPAGAAGESSSAGGAAGDGAGASAGAGGEGFVCGDESLAGGIVCFDEPYGIAAEQGTPVSFVFTQWQGETGADLAILNSDSSLYWYGTQENGHFNPGILVGDVSGAGGVVLGAGRLDSGPGPDLIAGGDTSTTDIFFGTNAGHVDDTQYLVGTGTASSLFVADLPGSPAGQDLVSVRDGSAYLHVTTGSTGAGWLDEEVALYSGYPLAGDAVLANLEPAAGCLVVSRLDQPILLSAEVIWGDTVTLGAESPITIEAPAGAIDLGDFDEDGNPDIVASLVGPTHLNVLFGDGDGGFKPQGADSFASVEAGPWLQDVKIGDFNGDGHADIAASSRQDDAVLVILGDGQGGFADPISLTLAPGADPTQIEVSDLDEDEVDDIAVLTTDEIVIFVSNP